ncbi:MAG: nitroreductase family protein [Actinomycetota bacterium]|nr:nitroreductase family protein [Actinomycetota bacterium]
MTSVDLYEALMTTRAVRHFDDAPVTDDEIERCLAAACQASVAGGVQPYEFVVVTDAALRDRLARLHAEACDADADSDVAEAMGRAPVLVLVLTPSRTTDHTDGTPPDAGPADASVYPAVQNLVLAARSQGLGTALTTDIRRRSAEVRELLGIPDGHDIAALVPLGRPAERWGLAERRPWWTLTSRDRFGTRPSPGGG